MNTFFIKYLLFILPFIGFSQYSIQGKLTDNNGMNVAYANIILVENEKILTGTSTAEDGIFIFDNVAKGNYTLKISYLGFNIQEHTVEVNQNKNLGTLTLTTKEEMLQEVEVTKKKPTVVRKTDRLVFNVENSTLSNGSSWKVISSTPNVLQINGELTVKGRVTPVIYINDRRVYLNSSELKQFLEGTPANIIKSVEVITNPPARYDAEGGAVINIITSKNLATGYHGSIFTDYTQGNLPRFSTGTSHFYKTDKLNLFGSYSYNNNKYSATFFEKVNFLNNTTPLGSWETPIKRKTNEEIHTASANIDYFINPKQTLSLSVNTSFKPYLKQNVRTFTKAFNSTQTAIDSTFLALGTNKEENKNLAFNLTHKAVLNNTGESLQTNLFYVDAKNLPTQTVATNYYNATETLINQNSFYNNSEQKTKIYVGQIDYILPFKNSTLETGLKATNVKTESDLNQVTLTGNVPELTDLFKYDETNLAAYLSYEKQWEKWSFKLGLRGENTHLKGESFSENQTNKQDYFQLFPSFYIMHQASDNYSLNLQYSRRIKRPNYKQLNPFRYYFNDNSFQIGNPELQPSVYNKITLGQSYKAHNFELYYSYTKNPANEISFQNNQTKQIQYIYANIEQNINYGLDYYSYLTLTKFWGVYSILSVFYDEDQFIAIEDNNQKLKNERWGTFASINNYFTFLKDGSLTADVWLYYFPKISWGGTGTQSELKSVNIGINKTFWNQRASLSLQANDIFNTYGKLTRTNNYLSQQHYKKSYFDEQTVGLRFTYKFGNYNLSTNKKDIDLEEKKRIQ